MNRNSDVLMVWYLLSFATTICMQIIQSNIDCNILIIGRLRKMILISMTDHQEILRTTNGIFACWWYMIYLGNVLSGFD